MTLPAAGFCANCSQPLAGRYCAHCGEETHDPDSLTVAHFVSHTLAHELLHVDGKVWRTVRALIARPGFLAGEYCAGRRRAYVNPVRIFLTAIVGYAVATQGGLQASLFVGPVVLSVAPAAVPKGASIEDTVERIDRYGVLHRLVDARRGSPDFESEAVRERFHARLERFAEPLSFANVILLALALFVLFRRRRHLFVEHAVFSMHFMSVVLLTSLLYLPVLRGMQLTHSTIIFAVIAVVVVWQFAYLSVGIRRFYFADDSNRLRPGLLSAGAAVIVYLVNSAFITASQLAGGALALWTM